MKKRNFTTLLALALVSGTLVLASCGGPDTPNSTGGTGPASSSSTPDANVDEDGLEIINDALAADGSFDFSNEDWHEKTKITAALERYTMQNFTGGIPLYDDSASEAFSKRFNPKSDTYITNYGFGVMEGTLVPDGEMYNGPIVEAREQYKSYFHGYTNTDSGTFNGWDATGSDVSDRHSMITSGYYGVEMNATKDGYAWKGELARDAYPVMVVKSSEDDPGTEVVITGEDDPNIDKTSVYWRVYLHVGAGYEYKAVPGSKWANKAEFDGRQVQVEDYITPFKAMLDNKLVRYSNLITDASGFYKAADYVYDSNGSKSWETSGIGIQINKELSNEEYGVIDFRFIQPKSAATARTNLSSSLYSPIPQDFLDAIGGAKNFGVKGTTAANTFDNFLCFGAYIPVEWQSQKELIYTKNEDYYDADRYTLPGYTEVVYSGANADDLAWKDFKENKLDECTVPVSALVNKETYEKTYRTEGSTIIKINLNTCNKSEWKYFFGPNGKVFKHNADVVDKGTGKWSGVKDIMSNHDFLLGFFFAIDRKSLAETAGRNPAISYLSNAYMIDPTGRESYRDSEEGKAVVQEWIDVAGNEYCYNRDVAASLFHKAGEALIRDYGWEAGEEMTIQGFYRYQSTIDNLGRYISQQVADIFNDACADLGLTLNIDLKVGGTQYTDTYTLMDHGEFDFAEGAVSGNVLDPLNFMSTCSSSASLHQGFNLNWGRPTTHLSSRPAVYTPAGEEGELHWSFDALWSASQGFSVVNKGVTKELGSNQRFIGPDMTDDETGYTSSSKEITFLMDFPDQARNEDGDLLYEFEAKPSQMAFLPSDEGNTIQGGYYFNGATVVTNNSGWLEVHMPLSEVIDDCQRIATAEKKTVVGFTVQFYLVYRIFPGTEKQLLKTMIVTANATLAELGIDPIEA